jgi:hypothetical protein
VLVVSCVLLEKNGVYRRHSLLFNYFFFLLCNIWFILFHCQIKRVLRRNLLIFFLFQNFFTKTKNQRFFYQKMYFGCCADSVFCIFVLIWFCIFILFVFFFIVCEFACVCVCVCCVFLSNLVSQKSRKSSRPALQDRNRPA